MDERQTSDKKGRPMAADVDTRYVYRGAAMIVLGIVFAGVAAYATYRGLRPGDGYGGPDARNGMRVVAPVLQSAPQPERAAYFAEKDRLLNGYGWIDHDNRVARIPVAQAMQLLATSPDKQSAPSSGRRP